ncbi:unnamed protein product [Dibothriocephalus latus]|uniref:DUF7083 domain-containing protein n=1 Tax=Dibothriocephalus latus TaxID=60516 RepID=A0A3P7M3K2_DIBLA|nr:unnamed protein product [Dibothriocephalus latus]
MMESMMQKFSLHFHDPESSRKQSTPANTAVVSITKFIDDPDSSVTFDAWFKRWEHIFHVKFAKYYDDACRVRLLLRELSAKEHERYTDMILPKSLRDSTCTL